MQKPLDPNSHAVLDYALGLCCITVPAAAGFNCASSVTSYAIGLAQTGMSLCTKYPISLMKAIPFKVHSMIELGTAIGLMGAPFIPLFDQRARTFFFSSGFALLGVWLMTDYSDQAVAAAEVDLDQIRTEANEQVRHMVEKVEEHSPEPVAYVLRKAS